MICSCSHTNIFSGNFFLKFKCFTLLTNNKVPKHLLRHFVIILRACILWIRFATLIGSLPVSGQAKVYL